MPGATAMSFWAGCYDACSWQLPLGHRDDQGLSVSIGCTTELNAGHRGFGGRPNGERCQPSDEERLGKRLDQAVHETEVEIGEQEPATLTPAVTF